VTALVLRVLINAFALFIVWQIGSGLLVTSSQPALTLLLAGFVLAIVDTFIRPILLVLTLPLNVLTVGLFTLIVNAMLLLIVQALVPGIGGLGFWGAVWVGLLLAIVSWVLNTVVRNQVGRTWL
jgi:putative membrane protein